MKTPHLQDEAFLADLASVDPDSDALHAWWLGQSGFLVQWRRHRILFDPYLSDSLTEKYADTDKPHTRMTGQVVAPGLLTGLEVVTSSHNHTDHLDRETLRPILAANPDIDFIIPEANRAFVADRLGCAPSFPRGMNDGDTLEAGGATFHGLPSAHDELRTDKRGNHHFMGFVIELGPWTVYHSGDTRLYDGLAGRLGRFDLDLAFLPINGWAPERRVAGNLDAREAVALAKRTGVRMVVPHHFDMFAFNTADPAEFAAEAARHNQPATVLQNGERLTLER